MATLFRKPGYPRLDSVPFSLPSSIGFIVLYILVAIILVVIVLMLMGVKIDLNWFDFRSPYTKVISRSTLFWPPTTQFTNLTTSENAIPGFSDSSYTSQIECVIYNTRSYNTLWTGGDGPYRHIYHRGSKELMATTVANMLLGGCGSTGNSSELPPYGLPSRMNPGLFLDPNINDLILFIDTENGSRESARIPDIPLDIPFRISIVVNRMVLEVYLNCKLELTKILKNMPKPVENKWYGLAGSAGAQAQIQNFRVWKYPLTSTDHRPLCPGLPKFKPVRPMCEGADTVVPAQKTKEPGINLGFDKAIKCPK